MLLAGEGALLLIVGVRNPESIPGLCTGQFGVLDLFSAAEVFAKRNTEDLVGAGPEIFFIKFILFWGIKK